MTTQTKKWAIALALSAALNCFLLGIVTVHLLRHAVHRVHPEEVGHRASSSPNATPPRSATDAADSRRDARPSRVERPGRADDGGPALLREMVRALGGPRDPRVKKAWEGRQHDVAAMRKELQAAHEGVRAALRREPFDQQALELALTGLHEVTSRAQRNSQAAVVAMASQLTSEERQRILARVRPGSDMHP